MTLTLEKAIEIITNVVQTGDYTAERDRALAIVQNACNLINRKKAEIKSLKEQIKQQKKLIKIATINADTAFQNGLNEAQELYREQIKSEVKSEAIKEFAERLCADRVSNDPVVIAVKSELKMMEE